MNIYLLISISIVVATIFIIAYRADKRLMKSQKQVDEMQAFGSERKKYRDFIKGLKN